MKALTIVIPNRYGETPKLTINSLYRSEFTNFDIIIINDTAGNANVARNQGFGLVRTPYVLFSDNDINWEPWAIGDMFNFLEKYPKLSFCWGSYELNGRVWCNRDWDPEQLKKRNYISTMSLVRTAHHPGFDEKIKRLQDWDVWLTMMKQGRIGKYIGKQIFTTPVRNGITRASISWEEALAAIKLKHQI